MYLMRINKLNAVWRRRCAWTNVIKLSGLRRKAHQPGSLPVSDGVELVVAK